jgi:tRNA threonylcarbamoyladenosine biosynthesis protein TsaB
MPTILALDNSTPYLSMAYGKLLHDKKDISQLNIYHQIHNNDASKYIINKINQLIDGKIPNYLAVGVGPGAFTGVRLACSTAMALAYAWDIPIIGVCSLASAIEYYTLQHQIEKICGLALLDARMNELYATQFSYAQDILQLEDIKILNIKYSFTQQNIFSNVQNLNISDESILHNISPHAVGILSLAIKNLNLAIKNANIIPNYVRNKVASTILERKI